MANVARSTIGTREETLSRDVDALHRQINTLGRRLAEAQARHKKTRRREGELREAIADALFAFDQGRTQDAAGRLRGALNGGGDGDA
jgi:predicted  nucleic acid-binding Zn-ribbon protein